MISLGVSSNSGPSTHTHRWGTQGTSVRSSYNTHLIHLVGNQGVNRWRDASHGLLQHLTQMGHTGVRGAPQVRTVLWGGVGPALRQLASLGGKERWPDPPPCEGGRAELEAVTLSAEWPASCPVRCCDTPFSEDWEDGKSTGTAAATPHSQRNDRSNWVVAVTPQSNWICFVDVHVHINLKSLLPDGAICEWP